MPYFRVTLTLTTALGTPMHSGTLWGHFAWAVRYSERKAALEQWLRNQMVNPWLLSSAMPEGMLPRPLLRPCRRFNAHANLKTLEARKKRRKMEWIPENLFLSLRERLNEDSIDAGLADCTFPVAPSLLPARVAHNTIDRISGTTPAQGGLYFKDDWFPLRDGTRVQIFIEASVEDHSRIDTLLGFIGENGFGRDASIGRGTFTHEMVEEGALFAASGDRAMSLSHGVVTDRMKYPRYKLHTHFGKLGGHRVNDAAGPYKYPVLMARPGTTYTPEGDGPYGRLLGGEAEPVHRRLIDVHHHALHLPLFFTEEAS